MTRSIAEHPMTASKGRRSALIKLVRTWFINWFGQEAWRVELTSAWMKVLPIWLTDMVRQVVPNLMAHLDLLQAGRDAIAFQTTRIIGSALQAGIFSALQERPLTVEELARLGPWNPVVVSRLLQALEALGYVRSESTPACRRYHNRPLARALLTQRTLAELHRLSAMTWPAWNRLDDLLYSGQPDPEMALFGGCKEIAFGYFSLANALLATVAGEIVDRLPTHGWQRVIIGEVGLPFAAMLLEQQPDLKLTVAALGEHQDLLERLLELYPLPPVTGLEIAVSANGDALQDAWGDTGYDAVLLYRKVTAYVPYGEQYLAKSYQVLAPGGVVIVIEPTTDSVTGSAELLQSLQVMDLLIGGAQAPPLRSSHEIAALLRSVGFVRTEVIICENGIRAILGWKGVPDVA